MTKSKKKKSGIGVANFKPTLLAAELVAVQPMSAPSGDIHYADFVYETKELTRAKDPFTTKEELIVLCTENYELVREAIIKHPNADSDVLYVLSTNTTNPVTIERILKSGKLNQYHKDLIELGLA